MRIASDKRINKRGELKIDKRYHISFGYYGRSQGQYGITFPVLYGEWLGVFDTLDEAVQHATHCHKHNYAINPQLWGLDQRERQKMLDKLDNQINENV